MQRANSHSDHFSSQHAEPWKAVRSKDEGAFRRSGKNKLIEEKAIKETSEPIASPTTLSKTNATVPAASSHLELGVTTCPFIVNWWTIPRGCKRETRTVSIDAAKSQRRANRGQPQLHQEQGYDSEQHREARSRKCHQAQGCVRGFKDAHVNSAEALWQL